MRCSRIASPVLSTRHNIVFIVDEAHRMSASDESHKSLRYKLGELLRDTSDHLLLLTATPHKGEANHSRFKNLLLLLDDEISFDSTGFANVNLDRTRRRGLLVSGEWSPWRSLSLSADYAYTGNEVTAGPFDGTRIPLVAEHSGRVAAGWSPRQEATLYAEGVYVGPRVLGGDFANDFPELGGYGVLNLAGQWRQAGWRVALRVNNVLNREYSEVGAATETEGQAEGEGRRAVGAATEGEGRAEGEGRPAVAPTPRIKSGWRYHSRKSDKHFGNCHSWAANNRFRLILTRI